VATDANRDRFAGFPPAALEFYEGLEADNSRTYWQAHKATFEQAVRAPMAALLAELPEEYQPFHVFRPNRDVRFSADKSPYKTIHGAGSETAGGAVHYLHVSSEGLLVASGMYALAPDQLERFRAAVAAEDTGPQLEQVIAKTRRSRIQVASGHDEPLKSAPRGYPRDHPRIELLRWKGCMASTEIGDASVLGSSRLRQRVVDVWRRTQPLVEWLERNVGPSTQPRELGRRR
jgi:uncharacterized protein (TIGR02453 family)